MRQIDIQVVPVGCPIATESSWLAYALSRPRVSTTTKVAVIALMSSTENYCRFVYTSRFSFSVRWITPPANFGSDNSSRSSFDLHPNKAIPGLDI